MKVIVLGLRSDDETQALSAFATTYYWEDYKELWWLSFDSKGATLHSNETELLSLENCQLIVRSPSESVPSAVQEVLTLLRTLRPGFILGMSPAERGILNKASQLKYFGSNSPSTWITNCANKAKTIPGKKIVKSLSPIRSQVVFDEVLWEFQNYLHLPTLFQEYCEGKSIKTHVLYPHSSHNLYFSVLWKSNTLDPRSGINLFENIPTPTEVNQQVEKLFKDLKVPFFDLDCIQTTSGLKFLEFNLAPTIASFEKDAGVIPTFTRAVTSYWSPVILGTSEDPTYQKLRELFPEAEALNYDHLSENWHYEMQSGVLFFLKNETRILPQWIYDRGITSQGEKVVGDLISLLEAYPGRILTRPSRHFFNGSKPFQMIRSLASDEVYTPNSYLIKGWSWRDINKDCLIVKSCSGVRSQVVDESVFSNWATEGLENIPTLFQEKKSGEDVRVHCVGKSVWGSSLLGKSSTDYRYQDHRPVFSSFDVSESLEQFVRQVSAKEENGLLGVDFIRVGDQFYCLEANPGPGWSYFLTSESEVTSFKAALLQYFNESAL